MEQLINNAELNQVTINHDDFNDVSEQYKLLQREHKAVMAAINMANIVSEANERGVVLSVNDKLCEVSQYSREECIGKPHNMFRHPDMPKSVFKELWATISSGKVFHGKIKNKRKDGTPYYVDALISPVLDDEGKVTKYIGIRTDTTDIEVDLIRYRGIFNAINETAAVIEFTPEGIIKHANELFLNTVGYALDEIVGQHHRMFVEPEEARSQKYSQFWDDLRKGLSFADTFRRFGRNGKEIWIKGIYAPQKDEYGRLTSVVKVVTDVTEEKLRELDLMKKVNMILDVMSAAEQGDLQKEL